MLAARVRADIRSELCLLSETGPISIPLICTYPRVVPSLATQKVGSMPLQPDASDEGGCLMLGGRWCVQVVFDNVVMGEKSTFLLTIRNDGAIPTRYTISAPIEEMYTSARQEAKDEEGEEDGQASEAPPEEGAQDGTKTPAEAQTIRKAVVIAGEQLKVADLWTCRSTLRHGWLVCVALALIQAWRRWVSSRPPRR